MSINIKTNATVNCSVCGRVETVMIPTSHVDKHISAHDTLQDKGWRFLPEHARGDHSPSASHPVALCPQHAYLVSPQQSDPSSPIEQDTDLKDVPSDETSG